MGLFRRKDSDYWWMSFSHKASRYRLSTGTANRKLAEKIYAKVVVDLQTGTYFPELPEHHKTVTELLEKYMTDHSVLNKKPRSHQRDHGLKAHLVKAFGALTLAEVTPAMIAAYKTARRQTGVSPATVNRELGLARHAFNLAMREWEWTTRNPFTLVTREREPKGRDRWLRDQEEPRLLTACPLWLRGLVEFALETGLRVGEILTLSHHDVNLIQRTLCVEAATTKNGLARTLPLSVRAEALIREQLARRRVISPLVFGNRKGGVRTLGTINRAFRQALRRARIVDFRFHDLRHTFATRLCQAGVDLYIVQRLLGHQDPKMTQRYAHHCTESLRSSMQVLDHRFMNRRSRAQHAEGDASDDDAADESRIQ